MIKKFLLGLLGIVILLVLLEILGLLHEHASLKGFAEYWAKQNKTASGTFTYVALGDSTAQGIGSDKPTSSYVGLLADRIAQQTGQKVRLINLSVSGAKIDDVLNKQIPELKNYHPDIVTVEVGANDLANYKPEQFKSSFEKLVSQLPENTYISDMPYFGGRIRKNDQALAANVIISKAIDGKKLHLVKLQQLTRSRQSMRDYAVDLFHPSSRGYINWADAFWIKIQPRLAGRTN